MSTGDLSPEQVPWTTAPERVADICDALDVPDPVRSDADLVSARIWRDSARSPSVLAAALVYHSGLVNDERYTQAETARAADCSQQALQDALKDVRAEFAQEGEA